MTNKPMLSVERDLIERLKTAECRGTVVNTKALQELRAILDEPPVNTDVRTILLDVVPGDGNGLEVYAKSCEDVEKVLSDLWIRIEELETAQHHGDPVMPGSEEFSHMSTIELRGYHAGWHAACMQNRSAEQPAPVAVVIPERMKTEPFTTINRGSKNYKAGYNAAIAEAAKLNGLKP